MHFEDCLDLFTPGFFGLGNLKQHIYFNQKDQFRKGNLKFLWDLSSSVNTKGRLSEEKYFCFSRLFVLLVSGTAVRSLHMGQFETVGVSTYPSSSSPSFLTEPTLFRGMVGSFSLIPTINLESQQPFLNCGALEILEGFSYHNDQETLEVFSEREPNRY